MRKRGEKMQVNREKIEIAMAAKKYSIVNLAELYGVSHQRMRVILNSQKVSTVTAGKLADALGVPVTEIID